MQIVRQIVRVAHDRPANDFRADLRHSIPEPVENHVLEHEIADPPIGRDIARAFDRFDVSVGNLLIGAVIEAPRIEGEIELLAVRPNAAERCSDAAFAKGDREGEIIVVDVIDAGDGEAAAPTAAFAAAGRLAEAISRFDPFFELRAPDDIAAKAHAAPQFTDRRALGGSREVDVFDALAEGDIDPRSPRASRAHRTHQQGVDAGSDQSADRAANAGDDGVADRAENERGH
jgi:hypothetical protein